MKAKMPAKPAEPAEYLCVWCDMTFEYKSGTLCCPDCGNSDRRDLIPIYVENNPLEEALYCPIDWHGG